jgi:phage internal scaffolding protein
MVEKNKENQADVKYDNVYIAEVGCNSFGVKFPRSRCRVSTVPVGNSLTKQADKSRANIHNILHRYDKTGLLPQRIVQPITGNLPDVESYHDAMNRLVTAQTTFNSLPSRLREKFQNDPAKFLQFVSDEKNIDEMVQLGLASKKTPPAPQKAEEGAFSSEDSDND